MVSAPAPEKPGPPGPEPAQARREASRRHMYVSVLLAALVAGLVYLTLPSWQGWLADWAPALAPAGGPPQDIFAAVNQGDLKRVRALVRAHPQAMQLKDKGGQIIWQGRQGTRPSWTPLMLAAAQGRPRVVACLLELGAPVNQADAAGSTALMAAVIMGHRQAAEALIKGKADLNQADEKGYTPLMAAVLAGAPAMMDLLLRAGCDHGRATPSGATALHLAAASGRVGLIEVLARYEVDLNPKDSKGRTPLALAQELGWDQAVQLLRSHGAKE